MNEIIINNEVYIKKHTVSTTNCVNDPIKIVVLNRGWIAVGKTTENGSKTFIRNASIVRVWGTSKGLGEIAEKGPLSDTVLDKCGEIEVETCNVVLVMSCNQENWNNSIS